LANRAVRINISGIGGIIFLIVIIALGFLALSFFIVFMGIVLAVFLIGFLIRKILFLIRIKKEVKVTNVERTPEKMIEIPSYEVIDNDDSDSKPAL
jgi:hypothetical protein